MKAKDIMTREVISVPPDMPAARIARLLVDAGISAAPVLDEDGTPLGMVSEGDLIGRAEADREARRDWWLLLAAEGPSAEPRLLDGQERLARDIMASPVITVAEETESPEIARLLASYRIKRVPVLRNGKVVGIVSRADLLHALANQRPVAPEEEKPGLLTRTFAEIEERFGGDRHAAPATPPEDNPDPTHLAAADFQRLLAAYELGKEERREESLRTTREQRQHRVEELAEHHIDDDQWRGLLRQARDAAAAGAKDFLMLRFPSQLCSDGGRAINVTEEGWPSTLRGEPADIFLRWEHDLKPHGFHLSARILDFPGGFPGDVGLFLAWGH